MNTKEVVLEEYNGRPEHRLLLFSPLSSFVRESLPSHHRLSLSSLRALFVSVFLPAGYPHTVTSDYAEYQVWDTIQAFASSMTGALATEAVLKGIGVGNESATALAASLTWLVKDGLGMVGRIAFSWAKGDRLDCDVKRTRLGKVYQHEDYFQARCNNLADVAAKDGSQETLVNVVALLASLVLLPAVSGFTYLIWTLFALFTLIHLYANYRAVRSLQLDVVNSRTLCILVREFLTSRRVLSVAEANFREPVFGEVNGGRRLGSALHEVLAARGRSGTKESKDASFWAVVDSTDKGWLAVSPDADRLMAAFHLEWIAAGGDDSAVKSRFQSLSFFNFEFSFERFKSEMAKSGWRKDAHHLGFDHWTFRFLL